VSLLEVEVRCADLAFTFAINRPDQICLIDKAAAGFEKLASWRLFLAGSADTRPIREWLQTVEHRSLIDGFAFTTKESVQVYVNCVHAMVGPTRVLQEVVERVLSLAESVPPAPVVEVVDCFNELPQDLRDLNKLFARWAISDDDERQERVTRSSKVQRAQLRRVVEPLLSRIDEYLDSLAEPFPDVRFALAVSRSW
jgi:hypothetical protein